MELFTTILVSAVMQWSTGPEQILNDRCNVIMTINIPLPLQQGNKLIEICVDNDSISQASLGYILKTSVYMTDERCIMHL